LPRFPAKDRSPKPTSVALLKHSQRSFVQAHEPKPKHPNRKAPPPALLFLPSTMSKNKSPNPPTKTPGPIKTARSRPPFALKSPRPATPLGAALGPNHIGASQPSCQAMSGQEKAKNHIPLMPQIGLRMQPCKGPVCGQGSRRAAFRWVCRHLGPGR
jgi:hypothetical protein